MPRSKRAALRAALHDELATLRAINESLKGARVGPEHERLVAARATALQLATETLSMLHPSAPALRKKSPK